MTIAQTIEADRAARREEFEQFQRTAPPHEHFVNVGATDRRISTIAGGALLLAGLGRRGWLGWTIAGLGGSLLFRSVTGHDPLYRLFGLDTARNDIAEPEKYFQRSIHVEQCVTINKSPHELYAFWRDLNNLPRIMRHVKTVQVLDGTRSHWTVSGPAGMSVEWDAQIINDEPDRLIAWRSLGGAQVDNAGSVRFIPQPGDRGTEVKVVLDYIPPAGRVGSWIASMFGQKPKRQIAEDLWRFKCLIETGSVPTTEGQPRGTCH
jgi:uncharacterized membrane protein